MIAHVTPKKDSHTEVSKRACARLGVRTQRKNITHNYIDSQLLPQKKPILYTNNIKLTSNLIILMLTSI